MTWPAASPTGRLAPGAGVRVLHDRPLRDGVTLSPTPQLSDDIWPLSAAVMQVHRCPPALNFHRIPDAYRLTSKHVVYAMLSGIPPPGEQRRTIATIRTVFTELQRFLVWLDGRQPSGRMPPPLADVTPADIRDYHQYLAVALTRPQHRAFAGSAVGYLWRYRHCLPASERLSFDPGPFSDRQRHQDRSENSTERIPESVHGPLLGWSIRFTTEFAPDILAACRQQYEHLTQWPVTPPSGSGRRRPAAAS